MEENPIFKEIISVINGLKKTYKKTQREIEKEMGYSEDYISGELTKGGNKTLLKKLKKYQVQMAERAKNPSFEVLDIVREMRVDIDIMFSAVAELVAKSSGQSTTIVKEQFQKVRNERLGKEPPK